MDLTDCSAPQTISGYIVKSLKGRGNFGAVYLAIHEATGQKVALKIVPHERVSGDDRYREFQIMRLLRHPNIVTLLDVMEAPVNLYMVLEYASGGDLASHLADHGPMSENAMVSVSQQIGSALHYCHSHHVVHRDLKAENILFDHVGIVKIIDFGLSKKMTPGEQLETACGTPVYVAPELFQGKRYAGPEVDAWSFGILLFHMFTNRFPFTGESVREIGRAVTNDPLPVDMLRCSSALGHLTQGLLQKDPLCRYTVEQVLVHPWTTVNDRDRILPFVNPESMNILPRANLQKKIVRVMQCIGYSRQEIEDSLQEDGFSYARATYSLIEASMASESLSSSSSACASILVYNRRLARHDTLIQQAQQSYQLQELQSSSSLPLPRCLSDPVGATNSDVLNSPANARSRSFSSDCLKVALSVSERVSSLNPASSPTRVRFTTRLLQRLGLRRANSLPASPLSTSSMLLDADDVDRSWQLAVAVLKAGLQLLAGEGVRHKRLDKDLHSAKVSFRCSRYKTVWITELNKPAEVGQASFAKNAIHTFLAGNQVVFEQLTSKLMELIS